MISWATTCRDTRRSCVRDRRRLAFSALNLQIRVSAARRGRRRYAPSSSRSADSSARSSATSRSSNATRSTRGSATGDADRAGGAGWDDFRGAARGIVSTGDRTRPQLRGGLGGSARPAQQLHVALFLLPGPARELLDVAALDQPPERRLHRTEVLEVVQALAALLQLARRLRAAQHQHAEQRELVGREPERLVEQVAILRRARAVAARKPRPAAAVGALQRVLDDALVVVDDRGAVRRLVAREPQRVERERIGVRRRALLLDQAAEHADLDGIGFHAPEPTAARAAPTRPAR